MRREHVDDAVDGGAAEVVCRVPNIRWPVSAVRGDGDGLEVAHFADQDDVRVLAQRRAQRLERARVAVHLALVDAGSPVLVEELDRVLDGEEVVVRVSLMWSIIAASVVDLPRCRSGRSRPRAAA